MKSPELVGFDKKPSIACLGGEMLSKRLWNGSNGWYLARGYLYAMLD